MLQSGCANLPLGRMIWVSHMRLSTGCRELVQLSLPREVFLLRVLQHLT